MNKAILSVRVRRVKRGVETTVASARVHQALDPEVKVQELAK